MRERERKRERKRETQVAQIATCAATPSQVPVLADLRLPQVGKNKNKLILAVFG